MKKHNLILIASIVMLSLFVQGLGIHAQAAVPPKPKSKILMLNSYHKGYEWTDSIVRGVESIILEENRNSVLDIEYMDFKKIEYDAYEKELYEIYKHKYYNKSYDVIISSDNEAFQFLLKYRDSLFPNIPIVFCGVNNFRPELIEDTKDFIGVTEETDFIKTIDIAIKLHPKAEQLFVICDKTVTGSAFKIEIEQVAAYYENSIKTVIFQDDKLLNVLDRVKTLPTNSIILLAAPILKDDYGTQMSLTDVAEQISSTSNHPIYSVWDFYIDHGLLGGMLSSGYEQGREVARLAEELTSGKKNQDLKLIGSYSKVYKFDYNLIKKFNIDMKDLPPGSIIVNKPSNNYNISKTIAWFCLVLFMSILLILNIMFLTNIKRKKIVEKNLNESQEVLRATLNATADGILVCSNDRKIIEYNELFKAIWDIKGDLKATDDDALLLKVINQLENAEEYGSWVKHCYEASDSQSNVAFFKDGRIYEVYSVPLLRNGLACGRVWSFKNITARKHAERELQSSEERYRKLVELCPDAIFMSINGRNIFTNTAGLKMLGYNDFQEIETLSTMGLLSPEYHDMLAKRCDSLTENGMPPPLMDIKFYKSDGSLVDVEISSIYFDYKGDQAILSIARDITERKKAQELETKMKESRRLLDEALEYDKIKTEFFANISHELKTPLNIILGSQQLFDYHISNLDLEHEKKEKIDKYIKMLKQNCYRLLRLVNNLIDITKIDSGFYSLQLQNHNIVSIVEDITLSVSDYVEAKGVKLTFDTDIEEKIIACDVDKIERILMNLLSNSLKFTNCEGKIDVRIESREDKISIIVEDNGIGIPEDKQHLIFERFRQVDKSFVRSHEGSGIGLSLVKSLVELHEGSIELESHLGRGSRFVIHLPVRILEDHEDLQINNKAYQSRIEKINIEFSDIYYIT